MRSLCWPSMKHLLCGYVGCTFCYLRVKLEQGTVLSLLEKEGVVMGARYRSPDGEEKKACAPLTFVCDGCFSNLRRSLCNPKVQSVLSREVALDIFLLYLSWVSMPCSS